MPRVCPTPLRWRLYERRFMPPWRPTPSKSIQNNQAGERGLEEQSYPCCHSHSPLRGHPAPHRGLRMPLDLYDKQKATSVLAHEVRGPVCLACRSPPTHQLPKQCPRSSTTVPFDCGIASCGFGYKVNCCEAEHSRNKQYTHFRSLL